MSTHRLTWLDAASLEDLGQLTAEWLEGGEPNPCAGYVRPDKETTQIAAYLAQLNRLGFVTDMSQPGVPLNDGDGQRAFVMGYCRENACNRVVESVAATDLVAIACAPGYPDCGPFVVVTLDDGSEFTHVGGACDLGTLTDVYRWSPRAWPDLAVAWQVTVLDPVWGRDDLLWPTLCAALTP